MLREHRRFFLWGALAGLALRLLFFVYFPSVTDDSRVYIDQAGNWLENGVYGQTQAGQIVPTDTRLPGYPAFLAAVFWLSGVGNVRAVLAAQIVLDLLTCLLIADIARRSVPGRMASRVAFALAAACPFLANYAAAVLTETLEIFFTAVALDCVVAGLDLISGAAARPRGTWRYWTGAGAAIGACMLVRPDGGILLAAVCAYLAVAMWRAGKSSAPAQHSVSQPSVSQPSSSGKPGRQALAVAALVITAVALAPLVPWTIRNSRTLHHFQPLAPRYATEADELTPRGFNRWVKTWIAEYASVEDIYWNVPGDKIEVEKLPSRALDDAGRKETLAAIADYNESRELTPELDARFGELAAERIRAHPARYYVVLPLLRVADMWLRPRTELLPPDPSWWKFDDERRESALAVGFGVLNLIYVAGALMALTQRKPAVRYVGLLGGFLLMRSVFLGTIENPEPRYTLECYPALLVWAGAFFAARLKQYGAG